MNFPPMIPVGESSHLVSYGYDPASGDLFVQFKAGLYVFEDVDLNTHLQFMSAPSKGTFFHSEIKNRFGHRKVETKKDKEDKAEKQE